VEDNGQGIALENQDKIFEMFYRASIGTSGTGLGLYIVKEAVAKLNGEIKVSSVPGDGSKFTVFLPQWR
jgi:signal transduction histidine kinase